MYDYPCSENKGADQLCSSCTADLRLCFRICKNVGFLMTGLIYSCITMTMFNSFVRLGGCIFMPPTLKKWGTYWFRLVRVCVCVCIHVRDIVLKLHVWIPHGKIATHISGFP